MKAIIHGSAYAYQWHGCICRPCTDAHADRCRAWRQRRNERLAADPSLRPHGVWSTYTNWGCRCIPCRAAAKRARRGNR